MVQVVLGRWADHEDYGGGAPLVHIHHVERSVHGNGIAIKVYGEVKIAAKEVIFAREMKLNTIQELQLTVETGHHWMFVPQKWVYHKGEYDNYASVDIFCQDAVPYEMRASGAVAVNLTRPSALPEDGSIWLNFEALGE